jgi:hypothetical protein
LAADDKSEFLLANAHKIKPDDKVHHLINDLDLEHRLEFARTYRQNIREPLDLLCILSALKEADIMEYACQSISVINNASQVTVILNILPENKKAEFARLNQDKIKNKVDLYIYLTSLPCAERLSFLQANMDKIHNNNDFGHVASTISESERDIFMKEYQKLHRSDLYPGMLSTSRQNGFFVRDQYVAIDDSSASDQSDNLNQLPFRYTK